MKFRNGFVSNSSSTSFIVAFPRKPKTVKDVLDFMFNGEEGGIGLDYYDKGLSYRQVAEKVFNDIKFKNANSAIRSMIKERMAGSYHYNPNPYGYGERDEDGGTWSKKRGRYYGSNTKLMDLFKKATIEHNKKQQDFRNKERDILEKAKLGNRVSAYKGGTDPYTRKPYTKKQIKASKDREKALKCFQETNAEWIALRNDENKFWDASRKKLNDLRDKIAHEDANNFIDDNKGKYIFVVSYGDRDGNNGAIMEQGNIFRNVSHIVISNH